ncbi:hypothetical protein ACLOJK_001885, partial [Asimina triloba]
PIIHNHALHAKFARPATYGTSDAIRPRLSPEEPRRPQTSSSSKSRCMKSKTAGAGQKPPKMWLELSAKAHVRCTPCSPSLLEIMTRAERLISSPLYYIPRPSRSPSHR